MTKEEALATILELSGALLVEYVGERCETFGLDEVWEDGKPSTRCYVCHTYEAFDLLTEEGK